MNTTHIATVTREDGMWLADVQGLSGAHTYARSLSKLDEYVREVIVLAEDLPDEAMHDVLIEYVFDDSVDEAVRTAHELAERRKEIKRELKQLKGDTDRMIKKLRTQGYSTRDSAIVLDVTPGWISHVAQHTTEGDGNKVDA